MNLRVKLFADGADKAGILEMYENPKISGFTTNPTLMKKIGITDYKKFAFEVLSKIKDKPISFEVFSSLCVLILFDVLFLFDFLFLIDFWHPGVPENSV